MTIHTFKHPLDVYARLEYAGRSETVRLYMRIEKSDGTVFYCCKLRSGKRCLCSYERGKGYIVHDEHNKKLVPEEQLQFDISVRP